MEVVTGHIHIVVKDTWITIRWKICVVSFTLIATVELDAYKKIKNLKENYNDPFYIYFYRAFLSVIFRYVVMLILLIYGKIFS